MNNFFNISLLSDIALGQLKDAVECETRAREDLSGYPVASQTEILHAISGHMVTGIKAYRARTGEGLKVSLAVVRKARDDWNSISG